VQDHLRRLRVLPRLQRSVTPRVFLLSPARCRGPRASLLTEPRSRFQLAARLRTTDGVPLGELMSFLSGLYFRGKLRYARAFARPPVGLDEGAFVITPHAGLRSPETRLSLTEFKAAGRVDIRANNPRYRKPLEATAAALSTLLGPEGEAVLLGSVATGKYVDVLTKTFGDRLRFPVEFVGRGDMSRGGLMLRCVTARQELTYVAIGPETARHGPRPPKLEPLRGRAATPRLTLREATRS